MGFFFWLPILIFFYAVATIFSPNSKKGPQKRNQRPNSYGSQRYQPRSTSNQRPQTAQTKSSRPTWRDMFEELERELFPKETTHKEPVSSADYHQPKKERGDLRVETAGSKAQTTYPETISTEGGWGTEGREGVEGTAGIEGTSSYEGSSSTPRQVYDKPQTQPKAPMKQERVAFTPASPNPLVQGVIWAEVLGKPRAYNKMNFRRRI